MQSWLRVSFLFALGVMAACAHVRVAPAGVAQATLERRQRVHALAWGLMEPRISAPDCRGNGLASAAVHLTFLDALGTVVTAGFWTPVSIEWSCAADRVPQPQQAPHAHKGGRP